MSEAGIVEAIRIDLERLHRFWMTLAFRQLRKPAHPVMGTWSPETPGERVAYRVWSVIGVVGLLVAYPLAVAGFAVRFNADRIDGTATRLGAVGSVVLAALVWGALTLLARVRFSAEGFLAVGAAAAVAVVSTALAVVFSRVGGRVTTVVLAYPLGINALFLPPVVAALYSPTLAGLVFPRSTTLAIWLLDNVLTVGGLNAILRRRFELVGLGYVAMWIALAAPVGWLLGVLVTLANVVRPGTEDDEDENQGGNER